MPTAEEELAEIKAQEEQMKRNDWQNSVSVKKPTERSERRKNSLKTVEKSSKQRYAPIVRRSCTYKQPTDILFKGLLLSGKARQKKADREAEKGSHYYRQRVCAVCGSTYWPTHSQQKFCSEECKKVNHNKKTLEFYYKKQKEKELCKDLLQTKEQVSDTNSSEITIIPAPLSKNMVDCGNDIIIDQKSIEKYGGNKMYFAPPIDYDKVMKKVPYGKVITVGKIREHFAKLSGADFTEPITAGIFVSIVAWASYQRSEDE